MEIKCNKDDVKRLIEKYYLEKEGRKVNADISVKRELIGYYGSETCITTILLTENVLLLGSNVSVTSTLNKDDLDNIFSELLESTGYTMSALNYDNGVRTEWSGYGMCERQELVPYFNGIKLTLEKNNRKVKML